MPSAYILQRAPTKWDHWGDYAQILIHGMTAHLGRQDGLLRLERVGPFVPRITFPGVADIVLTDAFKRELDSTVPGLEFRPVIAARMVRLNWTSWDAGLREPPVYPETGEPEDYVLARPHDPSLAEEMGDFWELVPAIVPGIQGSNGTLRAAAYGGQHLARAHAMLGYNFVSPELASALESAAPECIFCKEPSLAND